MKPEDIAKLPPDHETPLLDYLEELQCSNTVNSSEGSVDFPKQSDSTFPRILKRSPTAISTNKRSPHIPGNFLTSRSIGISASTTPEETNSISLPVPFLALGQVRQEIEQDLRTKNQSFGEKATESCVKPDRDTLSGSNLWELSIGVYAQSLGDVEWQDTLHNLSQSRHNLWEPTTSGNDCLLLPTLTTGSGTTRNAGRTKLESKLKESGIIPDGYQLSPEAMAEYMGLPWDWFAGITGERFKNLSGLFPMGCDGVMMSEDSQPKLSLQHKRRSPSVSSSGGKKKVGRPKGKLGKASGCLTPFVENRKGKTYPVVEGQRVSKDLAWDYPKHFNWFYQWGVWCDRREKWVTKSKRVKPSKVATVRYLIKAKHSVKDILHFIDTGKIDGQ